MITVKCMEDSKGCIRLTIRGHAASAPAGQDLVCAGVSALAYAAGEAVRKMSESGKLLEESVQLIPGEAEVMALPVAECRHEVWTVFWTVLCGLEAMIRSFPECFADQSYRIAHLKGC